MAIAVLSVFLLALIAPWLQRLLRDATGWVLAVPVVASTAYFASLLPRVVDNRALITTVPWVPELGLELAFRADGLSLLFLLLISGIGALILIFSSGYLAGHPQQGRFYSALLLFMGSMLGIVSADNLLLLFIFWELTSLSSYLLIGFEHEKAEARASALQALLVTGGGGLALLAGVVLMGQAGGSYSISELLTRGDLLREHALYLPMLLLILLAAFTKSAQFPFHFWLPGAMVAPTPVSAYLHSATMVKAGVFLIARLTPALGGTDAWHNIVTFVGCATMIVGALLALPQNDFKRMLAYSTVSALGTMTMLLGLGTSMATKAAVVFLIVHSLYKGALFMVAGAVDHETGTAQVHSIRGLVKVMPITAAAAGLAALSMSGFPPLLGFISKELLYEANLHAPHLGWVITGAGVIANVIMVAVAVIVGVAPFHGEMVPTPKRPHEAPLALWVGPLVLAGLGLFSGLFPALIDTPLLTPAATAVRAEHTEILLKLWHGLNPVLLLSVLTVLCGIALFLVRRHVFTLAEKLRPAAVVGPQNLYDIGLNALNALANHQTRFLQHGYLRYYMLTILLTAAGLTSAAMIETGGFFAWQGWSEPHFYELAIGALILIAALSAVRAQSRLAAVVSLGVLGYSVALVFALHGAPDLAITQILIETVTVVLFVFVIYHLPRFSVLSSNAIRIRDAVLTTMIGAVITLLVLKAVQAEEHEPISTYFAENSFTAAKGRNVVNVILVDFRALDTLGEITVLAVAALGVFALLKLRSASDEEKK